MSGPWIGYCVFVGSLLLIGLCALIGVNNGWRPFWKWLRGWWRWENGEEGT